MPTYNPYETGATKELYNRLAQLERDIFDLKTGGAIKNATLRGGRFTVRRSSDGVPLAVFGEADDGAVVLQLANGDVLDYRDGEGLLKPYVGWPSVGNDVETVNHTSYDTSFAYRTPIEFLQSKYLKWNFRGGLSTSDVAYTGELRVKHLGTGTTSAVLALPNAYRLRAFSLYWNVSAFAAPFTGPHEFYLEARKTSAGPTAGSVFVGAPVVTAGDWRSQSSPAGTWQVDLVP